MASGCDRSTNAEVARQWHGSSGKRPAVSGGGGVEVTAAQAGGMLSKHLSAIWSAWWGRWRNVSSKDQVVERC